MREVIYRFINCSLDSLRRELTVAGASVHLEPQVFDLLRHLVENRDRVVSRDELVDAVWQGRIVSEATIGARVFAARHAVGDTGESQAVIRTLPRRGFRFVAAVEVDSGREWPPGPEPPVTPSQKPRPRRRWIAIASALLLLAGLAAGAAGLLWWPGNDRAPPDHPAPPLSGKASVAVLPFVNLGRAAALDSMAEGLTESLVNGLGRNPFLSVIARSASAGYAGRPNAAGPAATELGMRYLLEGSVERSGDDVRVTTQLIDASGRVLWSERYRRPAGDFPDLSAEITAEIARTLDLLINYGSEAGGGTRSLAAWTEYVDGREQYMEFTPEGNRGARERFARALEIDPAFADAMVALARTYFIEMIGAPEKEWAGALARIDELQRRAAGIAPRMPQLFELRSMLALSRGDHGAALEEAEAMAALYPDGSESQYVLGRMRFFVGQYRGAIEALTAAERLNPDNRPSYSTHLAFSQVALGRTDLAIAIVESVVQRWPAYSAGHAYLAILYELAGRGAEARQHADLARRLGPQITMTALERRFSPMRDRDLAERIVEAARRAGIPD